MADIATYLVALAARLRETVGRELVGVYAGGSYALGAYEPGRSDVDVAAVVRLPLPRTRKDEVAARVRHARLPCPARLLELVVYRLDVVRTPRLEPDFELNLNTGRGRQDRLDYVPAPGERHWFAIDRSILASAGVAVTGPPAADVFAPLPPERLIPMLEAALRWHLAHAGSDANTVLNACRAWRFAREGVWSSKAAGGRWALDRGAFRVVEHALEARRDGRSLDPRAVSDLVEFVSDELRRLRRERAAATRSRSG